MKRIWKLIVCVQLWKMKAFQFSFPTFFFLPLPFFRRTKVSRFGRCVVKNSFSSSLTKQGRKVGKFCARTINARRFLIDGKQTDRSIWWTNERVDFSRMPEDVQILTGLLFDDSWNRLWWEGRGIDVCKTRKETSKAWKLSVEPSLTLRSKLQDSSR